ncbi:MAG: ferredoxin [bacterium]
MKATVDELLCVGTCDCQEICPQVFEVVDGLARVKSDVVPEEAEDDCRRAADNCPTAAIAIYE